MPLDNAQFISELSITDPDGTDPLNQGDDQIRATKRAVQQSLPLLDAAVSITSAQMNQMAIKNEANTFTQIQTFQQPLRAANGSAGAPAYSATSDPLSGMYVSASVVNFATVGLRRFFITANLTRSESVQFGTSDGTAAKPGYTFTTDADMGMFRKSAAVLGWSTLGVERMSLSNANLIMSNINQIRNILGSAAVPAYGFFSTINMGMYQHDGNTLGLAVAGAAKQLIKAASTDFVQQSSTGGVSLNFVNSAGVTAWAIQYEGTAGFQPRQFSFSRFNATTGAFIDIPLYIDINGRVHTALPVLSP